MFCLHIFQDLKDDSYSDSSRSPYRSYDEGKIKKNKVSKSSRKSITKGGSKGGLAKKGYSKYSSPSLKKLMRNKKRTEEYYRKKILQKKKFLCLQKVKPKNFILITEENSLPALIKEKILFLTAILAILKKSMLPRLSTQLGLFAQF